MLFLRRAAGFLLRKIQGIPLYRSVARRFRPQIQIKEATEEEWKAARAWLNPGAAEMPTSRNPQATDFVAKRGSRVVGFGQLVRYPEDAGPYAGYWLVGLTVKTPYRGMGIGEALYRKRIERAREEGAKELSLVVREDNRPNMNLARKLGFERKVVPALEAQLEEERLSRGRRRVVMSKSL